MDEKIFDVDGAYNVRYEILKKRIDKIEIKVNEVDKILINQDTSIKEEAKKEKEKWMS